MPVSPAQSDDRTMTSTQDSSAAGAGGEVESASATTACRMGGSLAALGAADLEHSTFGGAAGRESSSMELPAVSEEDAVALLQDENLLTVTVKVGLPQ